MKTLNKTAIALGTFDGLHKGHIEVLNKALLSGKEAIAVTFAAPPKASFEKGIKNVLSPAEKENALKELKKGLDIANKNGNVIMIGHVWSADFLPAFLNDIYPELKEKGYTFSVVSKSKARK